MVCDRITSRGYNSKLVFTYYLVNMHQFLIVSLFLLASSSALADEWLSRQKVSANFDDTKEAVVMAIENRGLVVNFTSHIADMLERTGNDIGASRKIYERAEIIEFCSAGLSRKMMELDPHNIVLCPFSISIYSLPGETSTTWISYRRPQGAAAKLVGPLLKEITAEVGN